jgi:tRNA pseudouridine55 synthase
MDGFINLLKPPGMTSSDAVVFVRRRLPKGVRTGHGGTLDPDAAGVLPVCVGKATRLFDYIVDKRKEYVAELTLGVETDTQDSTGTVIAKRPVCAGEREIRDVLKRFTGDIMQEPPMYSALKRDGRKLCDIARAGGWVELEKRRVTVHEIEYLGGSGEGRHMLRVECGKGVYIRTLLRDIGEAVGCGGHMSFLLRSKSGVFDVRDAHTPEEIDAANDLSDFLMPLDTPIAHIPRVDVAPDAEKAVRNGNPIDPEWIERGDAEHGEPVRVYIMGLFAGIAEQGEDGLLRFRAMLL